MNLNSLKKAELVTMVEKLEANVEVAHAEIKQLKAEVAKLRNNDKGNVFMRFDAFYPRKEAKTTRKGGLHLGFGKVTLVADNAKQLSFDVSVFRNKDESIGLAEKLVVCDSCRKAGVQSKITFPGIKLYDNLLLKLAPKMDDFIKKDQQ